MTDLTTKTIIADDHALIRAGLRAALATLPDLEIVGEVGDGRELTHALLSLQPDLLVVDVNMPEFEPVAAIQGIRSSYPDLKILVVSAYDDQSYVIGLLSAGVDGYHLKDQPLSDLLLAVRRILDGGRWISDPLVNRLVTQHTANQGLVHLTSRKRELLYLLTQGYNNQKIARIMNLSIKTIENHLTALYRSIGVKSRLEANHYGSNHPELLLLPGQGKNLKRPEAGSQAVLTVLLVDNNARYRAQLGKLLAKAYPACSFFEAEDCSEAYRLAYRFRPQMAFIDVILTDEDGITCVRKVKEISPNTHAFLMSAYPDREFRRLGMSAGAIAFLDKKDIDAATIRQVVEDLLEG